MKHSNRKYNNRGSTMVMALVTMAVGTMALTAWISLINARGQFVNQQEDAIHQRIARHNARAMAKEYAFRTAMTGTGAGASPTFATNWGTATIPSNSISPFATVSFPAGINRLGPADHYGYGLTLTSTVNNGYENSVFDVVIKSRSPVVSGDLFTIHKPAVPPVVVAGNINVQGRALAWVNGTYGFTADEFITMHTDATTTISNASYTSSMPSNQPLLPLTSGAALAAGVPDYSGVLNVIDNPNEPNNSLKAKVLSGSNVIVDGTTTNNRGVVYDSMTGFCMIDMVDPFLTNVHINSGVTHLELTGQANEADYIEAGNLAAIAIVVTDQSLSQITLKNHNNRRVLLAVKRNVFLGTETLPITVVTSGLGYLTSVRNWRLLMTLENIQVGITLDTAVNMFMQGGIRTNASVTGPTNSSILQLIRENDPKLLDRISDRQAWVEVYKQ